MMPPSLNGAYSDDGSQVLWHDGECILRRGWQLDDDGKRGAVLIALPAADHPSRSSLDRRAHPSVRIRVRPVASLRCWVRMPLRSRSCACYLTRSLSRPRSPHRGYGLKDELSAQSTHGGGTLDIRSDQAVIFDQNFDLCNWYCLPPGSTQAR
jgi:hypothetical protein